ncbi:DUF6777 domain-containing protein [Streptomyces sp. NPDC058739]|uniref:DUF6777 domain-containing protein n=1 Tax=Streptomyces sp. NPDC058739 TaxID=3346618 RepID=UPI0036A405FC
MSVEPPSNGRPTGPPSGPLSGPNRPPSGHGGPPPAGPPSQPPSGPPSGPGEPPSGPPSEPSGGGTPPGPHPPWWRSVPRVAALAAVVVAAVFVTVVLTRPDGGSSAGSGGEVFLQAAGTSGPDPFTESTATDSTAPTATPSPAPDATPSRAVRGVDGGAPGLYGGTRNVATCDVEKQVKALQAAPAKNKAFASVADVQPDGVPGYLRSLTPVQLRMDTRVTNHGFRDGAATPYQAVLQTGTAVLVDDRGVPRVRCACGNPLTPPVAQQVAPRSTGEPWPGYQPTKVVVVTPAPVVINVFVLYDPDNDEWIHREQGDTGGHDEPTSPPTKTAPPTTTAPTSPSPSSPSPSSPSPSSPSPSTESPSPPTTPTTPTTEPSSPGPQSEPAPPDTQTSEATVTAESASSPVEQS